MTTRCTCVTDSGQITWGRNCPERLQNQVRLLEQSNPYRKDTAACDGSSECEALNHIEGCFRSEARK
jgi:hypothetical protein